MRSSMQPGDLAAQDRTTKAKIRDAALTRFAADGIAATSIRAVAGDAGVAPSHVIHYFRSKDGLRVACDEFVAATLREQQEDVVRAGPDLDPLGALRRADHGLPILGYLARSLVEASPSSDALVDQIVADAERYMAALEVNGMLRPSADPRTRAILLTFWSLGQLALHRQLERLTGVRISEPMDGSVELSAFASATLELLGPSLLAPALYERLATSFAPPPAAPPPTASPAAASTTEPDPSRTDQGI